jgi:hypothetical protein
MSVRVPLPVVGGSQSQKKITEKGNFYDSSEDDEKWNEEYPLNNVLSCGWGEGTYIHGFGFQCWWS